MEMKIFIALTAIVIMSSCQEGKVAHSVTGDSYTIDTINIHGVDHEFLTKGNNPYFNGFVHSPECSCLKEGE